MDTMMAYAMGQINRNKEPMVFDWDTAAELINKHKPAWATAGLRGDKEYTEGTIYADGEPIMDNYTYLASTWAVPELEMDGAVYPCYKMSGEVPDWDAHTKWPESALKILKGKDRDEG